MDYNRWAPQRELLLHLLDSPGGQSEPIGRLTNRAFAFYRTLNDVKPDKLLLRHRISHPLILASALHPEGRGEGITG